MDDAAALLNGGGPSLNGVIFLELMLLQAPDAITDLFFAIEVKDSELSCSDLEYNSIVAFLFITSILGLCFTVADIAFWCSKDGDSEFNSRMMHGIAKPLFEDGPQLILNLYVAHIQKKEMSILAQVSFVWGFVSLVYCVGALAFTAAQHEHKSIVELLPIIFCYCAPGLTYFAVALYLLLGAGWGQYDDESPVYANFTNFTNANSSVSMFSTF